MARPLRWQRCSGANALTNLGRHSGRKLALSLTVARQENSVLTNTGARAVDLAHADVVDVGAAGDAALARHELALRALRRGRAGGEHVLEPPQHVARAGPQRLPVGPQPLALLDDALVRPHAAVVLAADEEQPSRLVGGEREADIRCREPCRESLRQQQQRSLVADLRGGTIGHRAIPPAAAVAAPQRTTPLQPRLDVLLTFTGRTTLSHLDTKPPPRMFQITGFIRGLQR
jgi:hypothetical protein